MRKVMKKKKIELEITRGDKNPVPAKDVVNIISGFQNLLYSLAEMKAGISRSQTGPKKDNIKSACELMISNVRPGSVVIEVTPKEPDITLFGFDEFPTNVLNQGEGVLIDIANQDTKSLIKNIPNDTYRDKIVRNVHRFLPKKNSDTKVLLSSGNGKQIKMQRMEPAHFNEVVFTGKLPPEQYFKKLSDIKGIAKIDSEGNFMNFEDIFKIEELPGIALESVKGHNYIYEMKTHLYFDIKDIEGVKVVTQSDLDISFHCEEDEDLKQVIGEEFDVLWKEYAEAADEQLHPSGLKLKYKLHELIYTRSFTS